MKLSYYCKSCNKKNFYQTKTKDRFELQSEVGNEINLNCTNCGTINKKHINRLSAEPNRLYAIYGLVIAAIVIIFLWELGYISGLTFTIPIYLYFDAEKKASDYNKIMVSRK
ncbi:MAG: hypothetical protein KUG68_11350 [Flavobacteriaceae bacterium]|nr:hypothetical protein [Flavobacteriaceae bacterium]